MICYRHVSHRGFEGVEDDDDIYVSSGWLAVNVEETYNSAVADLQWLDDVQSELGGLAAEEIARAVFSGVVHLEGAVEGAGRGGEVGQHAGHTDIVGFPWYGLKTEGVADGFLQYNRVSTLTNIGGRPYDAVIL